MSHPVYVLRLLTIKLRFIETFKKRDFEQVEKSLFQNLKTTTPRPTPTQRGAPEHRRVNNDSINKLWNQVEQQEQKNGDEISGGPVSLEGRGEFGGAKR